VDPGLRTAGGPAYRMTGTKQLRDDVKLEVWNLWGR
jgi:hypothetical protein